MSELVEQLRDRVPRRHQDKDLLVAAADRIEQLEAACMKAADRIDELIAALREIDAAVLAEREACAAIAAKHRHHSGLEIAELIRDQGPPPARQENDDVYRDAMNAEERDEYDIVKEMVARIEQLEARNSDIVTQCDTHAQQKMAFKNRIEQLEAEVEKWHRVAMEAGAVTCVGGGHIYPLRDRVKRSEAALREIAFDDITGASPQHKEIARAALAPEQDK